MNFQIRINYAYAKAKLENHLKSSEIEAGGIDIYSGIMFNHESELETMII